MYSFPQTFSVVNDNAGDHAHTLSFNDNSPGVVSKGDMDTSLSVQEALAQVNVTLVLLPDGSSVAVTHHPIKFNLGLT